MKNLKGKINDFSPDRIKKEPWNAGPFEITLRKFSFP
jgi:hypothetical protein